MLRSVLALLLIAFCTLRVEAAEIVFLPGLCVGLAPPSGFEPVPGSPVLQHKPTFSGILIEEMPAEAYDALIAEKMNAEILDSQGLSVEGTAHDWPIAGGKGRIMRWTHHGQFTQMSMWLVIARSPSLTAIVSAWVSDFNRAEVPPEVIEASLRTITLRAPRSVDEQIADLRIRIGDTAGLRPIRTIATGSALILTDGPKDVDEDDSQALVIVAPSLSSVPEPGERVAFSRKQLSQLNTNVLSWVTKSAVAQFNRDVLPQNTRSAVSQLYKNKLKQFKQIKDVRIEAESRDASGLVEWVRHEGRATDESNGLPIRMVQVMRFEGGGYVQVIGLGKESDTALAEKTRTLASSITLK